jgi:hypothetical protein
MAADLVGGDVSQFIIYADESGDHSLAPVDPEYPVFVLSFCIFDKSDYVEKVMPALLRFKFQYFGHDMVVLHEHGIRKSKPPFNILTNPELRERFMADLHAMMEDMPFHLVAAIIDKRHGLPSLTGETKPYKIALEHCLDMARQATFTEGGAKGPTHVVFESRGKKEDKDLELAFRRICGDIEGIFEGGLGSPFDIVFANKQVNSASLQIADLTARPLGRHYLKPDQPNRAIDVIQHKRAWIETHSRTPSIKIFGSSS